MVSGDDTRAKPLAQGCSAAANAVYGGFLACLSDVGEGTGVCYPANVDRRYVC